MTIKEAVEKVKKKFSEERRIDIYSDTPCIVRTDDFFANGYMQALDDVLKAEEDVCGGNKITVGVNKDGVIKDLEADIHRLKCEKEDLINHNENLDIYLDELKIENRILSEKWKVVELFMKK